MTTFQAFSLLILLFSFIALSDAAGSVGVDYGRDGNNLPKPDQVVQLLKSNGITKVKIYDTNEEVLKAFANSGISLVVAARNDELRSIATDQSFADNWVQSKIMRFYPPTKIEAISVGNEVFQQSPGDTYNLLPAMKNVHASLVKFNVDSNIKISSPLSFDCVTDTWPPSQGKFKSQFLPVIKPMLEFLEQTGSELSINIYPYFAYIENPDKISLDYALCNANPGVVDPNNGLRYDCLYDAQLDAVNAAIMSNLFNAQLNAVNASIMSSLRRKGPKPKTTESGWPSGSGRPPARKTMRNLNEIGAATIANAESYYRNSIQRVLSGKGTPLIPEEPLDVYLFALFDENLKGGADSEQHFGIFTPDGRKKYDITFTSNGGETWCVAKPNADPKKLQQALDFACGQGGADCGPIQPGAPCYNPNTLEAHASYAFNSYYSKKGRGPGTCDFEGVAYIVSQPPSFVNCERQQQQTTWCVAKANADQKKLQEALDYACGQGRADCGPIQPGAPCYNPNTLEAHASYAFNSYYQKNKRGDGTCDFKGVANVVSQRPNYGNSGCVFPTAGN